MSSRQWMGRAGLWLAALALGACTSGPFARQPSTQADDVAALKARIVELQRQVTVHEVELGRLRDRLVALESGRRPASSSTAPSPAPRPQPPSSGAALDDGLRHRPPAALEEDDLQEASRAATGVASPPPASSAPAATSPAQPASATAQAQYDQAFQLHQAGKMAEAESAFRAFLARWADTDLADNAGYWIGESRWSRDDVEGALAAFRDAIELQPDGNKVPDSLFKMGRCLERLGETDAAREVFGEVMQRFPGSAVATSAAERLAALH